MYRAAALLGRSLILLIGVGWLLDPVAARADELIAGHRETDVYRSFVERWLDESSKAACREIYASSFAALAQD